MKPFLYEQLTRSLLAEMASGFYSEGMRFLSNRRICRMWAVSETTAKQSLAWLVNEDLLRARPRSGYTLPPGFRRRALLLLHKYPQAHLPPPVTWEDKRRQLLHREEDSRHARLAVVFDGVEVRSVAASRTLPKMRLSSSECARGFFSEAVRSKCEIVFYLNNGQPAQQNAIARALLEDGIDGAAFFRRGPRGDLSRIIAPLADARVPVVSVFDDCKGANVASIDVNDIAIGYTAAQCLLAMGHRRLAFLIPARGYDWMRERCEGFQIALAEAGIETPVQWIHLPVAREIDGRRAQTLQRVFTGNPSRPTAVFSPSVLLVEKIVPFLASLRLRVPRDISLIACGSADLLPKKKFPYDLMNIDFAEIGRTAFASLFDLIAGKPVNRTLRIDPPYLRRGSVTRARTGRD